MLPKDFASCIIVLASDTLFLGLTSNNLKQFHNSYYYVWLSLMLKPNKVSFLVLFFLLKHFLSLEWRWGFLYQNHSPYESQHMLIDFFSGNISHTKIQFSAHTSSGDRVRRKAAFWSRVLNKTQLGAVLSGCWILFSFVGELSCFFSASPIFSSPEQKPDSSLIPSAIGRPPWKGLQSPGWGWLMVTKWKEAEGESPALPCIKPTCSA